MHIIVSFCNIQWIKMNLQQLLIHFVVNIFCMKEQEIVTNFIFIWHHYDIKIESFHGKTMKEIINTLQEVSPLTVCFDRAQSLDGLENSRVCRMKSVRSTCPEGQLLIKLWRSERYRPNSLRPVKFQQSKNCPKLLMIFAYGFWGVLLAHRVPPGHRIKIQYILRLYLQTILCAAIPC